MTKLDVDTLSLLPEHVIRPAYHPTSIDIGIVHLGIGRFHRAHEAAYTDAVMNLDPASRGWGICGVSLQSTRARDELTSQGGLYTIGESGALATRFRIIGSVREVLFAPAATDAVLARIASPRTRIVSLTITEKGYCRDAATGALVLPEGDPMQTALGWIARGLTERARIGSGALTLLSCDNLPANGRQLRRVLLEFCALHQPGIVPWVEANVSFPNSMVDRIVPELSKGSIEALNRELGYEDCCPVLTEAYSQWVVEDDFREGRPAWERVGVQFCNDVEPYEKMKLRLLNGSHSSLAYLGSLAGFETVDQAIGFAPLKRFIDLLMHEETGTTFKLDEGFDLEGYQASLIKRFENPGLKHRLLQIAMDGSQKLPQRLVAPALELIARGDHARLISLSIAAWIAFVARAAGRPEPALADPQAETLIALAREAGGSPDRLARAFLSVRSIFGFATRGDIPAPLLDQVRAWLQELGELGAKAMLEKHFKP